MIYVVIVLIYILLLGLFYVANKLITTHLLKMYKYVTYNIDELLYFYSKDVYEHKDNIYNLNSALEIAFHNKKAFINGNHHTLLDLYNFYDGMTEDVNYFSKLINKRVSFDMILLQNLKEVFDVLFKVCSIYKIVTTILVVMSFGIASLFVKKSFC